MEENWIKSFVKSAGAILLAAALLRFVIAAGNAQVLPLSEPMLGIPLRYAVLMVGGIELTVALICLLGKKIHLQIGWLTWLATNFVVFQIGLFWMHCHVQATCIGSLTDPLHLSRGTVGLIMQFLPPGLLLGSYAALFHLWLGKAGSTAQLVPVKSGGDRQAPAVLVRFLKISCISCGGHIEFPTNLLGEKIPCPHCRTIITLKRPENIKISCSSCDGHIEFPAHAIGQKIPCPHCAETVVLFNPL